MALESGIAQLVETFIAAGRPSSREQNIDDRRAGYIASAVLAGETETRVQVEDIELDAMTFRVVSPRDATGNLPCVIYYHGGCFVSGGFATHDNQLRQLAWYSGCRVIAVQYRLAPEHTSRLHITTLKREPILSGSMPRNWVSTAAGLRLLATARAGIWRWSPHCA